MKKIIISFLIAFFCFIPLVSAKDKVKVYVFSKEECPACASAEEHFNALLKEDSKLFDYVEIETFDRSGKIENQDAYNLLIKVLAHYNEDTEKLYTPTIVIGDRLEIGIENIDELEDYIKECSKNNTKDVLSDLAKENNISISDIRTNEPLEETNLSDTLILIGIFVVLIGGFTGLIIMGRK